ncbi:MAG: RecQ family ATP-dependent DNA helicase [Lachnoclostridium sp.]|nr:RecQ family ATP-dependent DNA helicase [Lachnoclostridium sp.]
MTRHNTAVTDSPSDILKRHWGYDSFRPMQEEIIRSVLDGKDTLGLLPTGGGKSLTFQVPALMLPGLTLVVTPLISLMKDQVDNLREHGIRAVYFHAGLSFRENNLAIDRCRLGKVKIAYVSPEKLQSERFMSTLALMDVSMIVVDEAHCISQWGYDFRPSYLKIATLRKAFPDAPVLALTASATPRVIDDIMASLEFRSRNIFSRSFLRDNISYIVRYSDDKERKLIEILRATRGCAIVYVRSRKRTREIAQTLVDAGISAEFYHAGLSPEEKELRQNRWKADETRVIVATNAFGMGIDKPDVRLVAHIDMPLSIEEYYQESGRAGRDGLPSFAVIITSNYFKGQLTRRVNESFPPKDFIARVYELAGNFLDIAVGSGYNTINEFNFNLFCETYKLPPVITRNALEILTHAGYIEFVEETTSRSRVMIIYTKEELYGLNLDDTTEAVLNFLLRNYTGLFADYVFINETLMTERLGIPAEKIYQSLLYLGRLHVLHYIPRKTTPYIIYLRSRELPKYIVIPRTVYEERRALMEERVEAIKQLAFTDTECRMNLMLKYFGENPKSTCGKCDVCRLRQSADKNRQKSLKDTILYLASHPGGTSIRQIADNTCRNTADVADAARQLADDGMIHLNDLSITLA